MAIQVRFILYYFVSFLLFHWLANTLFPPSPVAFEADPGTLSLPIATHQTVCSCPPTENGKEFAGPDVETKGNPLSARENFLTLSAPVVSLDPATKKVVLPNGVKRLCVDVGTFISSPTAKKWWQLKPDTFVLAIEANPFSYAMMKYNADPRMVSNPENYWPQYRAGSGAAKEHPGPNCNVSEISYCTKRTWKHITQNFENFLLINAAGYDAPGYMSFQMGVQGHPDTGSLYSFKQKKYASAANLGTVNVPAIRVGDLLGYFPDDTVVWDTLKIDAQGADSSVLVGIGDSLSKFLCVIGEFDVSAYNVKGKEHLDLKKYMSQRGFGAVDGRFFVNKRMKSVFQSGDYLCRATDEVRTKQQILNAIDG